MPVEMLLNVGGFEINFAGDLTVGQNSSVSVGLKCSFGYFQGHTGFLHIEPSFFEWLIGEFSFADNSMNTVDFLH